MAETRYLQSKSAYGIMQSCKASSSRETESQMFKVWEVFTSKAAVLQYYNPLLCFDSNADTITVIGK